MMEINCQTFKEACCGCCVNMKFSRQKLTGILTRNTEVGRRVMTDGRITVRRLVKWHWLRGGFWDHLLALWLPGPTLTLSAWIWKARRGCCPFAGFLRDDPIRVGCLVHPLVTRDGRDWRRWAFPLVPTLRCERDLRCGLLLNGADDAVRDGDWYAVSRAGAERR